MIVTPVVARLCGFCGKDGPHFGPSAVCAFCAANPALHVIDIPGYPATPAAALAIAPQPPPPSLARRATLAVRRDVLRAWQTTTPLDVAMSAAAFFLIRAWGFPMSIPAWIFGFIVARMIVSRWLP